MNLVEVGSILENLVSEINFVKDPQGSVRISDIQSATKRPGSVDWYPVGKKMCPGAEESCPAIGSRYSNVELAEIPQCISSVNISKYLCSIDMGSFRKILHDKISLS